MVDRRNPFLLDLPARVAFSGGRTSGFMLWHILQAFGGRLPEEVVVTFANTGKEREETLEFVRDCQEHWQVPIRWIEYTRTTEPVIRAGKIGCHGFREVCFKSASRQGEPFEALLEVKAEYRQLHKNEPPILPNAVQRFCTAELKQRTMKRFMRSLGHDSYTVAIGLRHDEPRRIAKLKGLNDKCEEYVAPLHEAQLTEEDVMSFWKRQPFDLQLQSYEGNCDNCFLKSRVKLAMLARDRPESFDWWAAMEAKTNTVFRRDRPSYREIQQGKLSLLLVGACEEDSQDTCMCTD